jgi:hypothetical protein
MKAGDTFRPADGTVDKFVHLWVVRKQSSFSTSMDPELWDILDRQGLV